jgi:hypothetical protein
MKKSIIAAISIGVFTLTSCDPKTFQSTVDTVLNSQNPMFFLQQMAISKVRIKFYYHQKPAK